jgi:hypothetical protein
LVLKYYVWGVLREPAYIFPPIYKCIRQVGVYTPKGVVPSARHLSHIVYTKIVIPYDTAKQSPTFISYIFMNIMLISYIPYVYPPSIFGIPPPPHLLGAPSPVSPLFLTQCQGSKGGSIPLAEYKF